MTIYNSELNPTFARSLAQAPQERDLVLVIRHSTRGPIPPDERGDEVRLTPDGIALAEQLGRLLAHRALGPVYSSTIPRCVETASALCRGAAQSLRIRQRPQLARPEPRGRAANLKLSHRIVDDPIKLVNYLLKAHRQNGHPDLPPAVAEILNCARDENSLNGSLPRASREGRLRVIVTHDDVIAFALAVLLDRDAITTDDLPWMLEGFFLWKEGERTVVLWRERTLPVAARAFSLGN